MAKKKSTSKRASRPKQTASKSTTTKRAGGKGKAALKKTASKGTTLRIDDPKTLRAFSQTLTKRGVLPALKKLGVELIAPCTCPDGSEPEGVFGPGGLIWVCPDGTTCP